jgi:hypothetical protein
MSVFFFEGLPCNCSKQLYLGFLCVIVLMTERKAFDYKHMFRVLKDNAVRLQLAFQPTQITTDFEPALLSVINAEVSLLLSDLPESLVFFLPLLSFRTSSTRAAIFTIRKPSIEESKH